MKATQTNFLNFLEGNKQLIIPIYQRPYSWTITQCQQLWNDILRAANDNEISGHFIGSLVYMVDTVYLTSVIPKLLVIDGQQRLTTLSLLLSVLSKAIKASNVEEYTIEHIMPQNSNLSLEWQADLGEDWKEIQAKYLHTIGNLTLTGYNPELSDRPFIEKRDINGGFADSPLRLNRGLQHLKQWNETEINKRAESLADMAVKVWSSPCM